MAQTKVPDVVVRRLPLYLQSLTHLAARGQRVVSSTELGEWVGVSSAQIRKDLSFFGEFGKQGLGYEVEYLLHQLRRILKADRDWQVLVVGAGALGHALINYRAFSEWGFRLVAVFDNDPERVGQPIGNLVIQSVEEMQETIQKRGISIAIVAVPPENAQEVADDLVAYGIRAILNYAPIALSCPEHVRVAYMDPVATLQSMTYYL